jgi:phenylalanyl-tRNA synthetase alpha chain
MSDELLLNEAAHAVWLTVQKAGASGIELGEVAKQTKVDQAQVSAATQDAAQNGYFKVVEHNREQIVVTDGAKELINKGLPEQLAAKKLEQVGGRLPIGDFIAWAKSCSIAPNEVFKWGAARGWIERVKGDSDTYLLLTEAGKKRSNTDDDIRAISEDRPPKPLYLGQLVDRGINLDRVRALLTNRPELAKIKDRTERVISITDKGAEAFKSRVRKVIERNTLTPEDLESGAWREIHLRPYDVKLAAKDVYPAKIHPLRKIIEQTRRAFLEMGFAEVVSPMVESAFWNFDALFQPQDHPARDMQDTFYMRDPAETPLPDAKIVEPVCRTHEDGWETGSEGWGYKWSPERSKQVVLRTHTTAATIRALAANPNPPGKFFCVGWTYRNETISFKHLPVFHQVDGIIIDEEANLASLMGTLQEFYSKMGFGRVKFKPAFYPYTEPSVDVVVYMESRGKWIEMGGAGIFRPEVTLPLGCKYPVLAWGLGIERLAMIRFGVSDIRELYGTNLGELEKVPLCK